MAVSPGLDGVEWRPEAEEPRMLSAVDAVASGGHELGWTAAAPHMQPSGGSRGRRGRRLDMRRWVGGLGVVLLAVALISVWQPLLGLWADFLAEELREDTEWPFEQTGLRDLQATGLTGRGVRVCVVDTGMDVTHPELQGANLLAFRDFVQGTTIPIDHGREQHGTMMIGILAANGTQLVGGAPEVSLVVAAALGRRDGSGTETDVADAIRWCVDDQRADIISLSLGGSQDIENPLAGESVEAVEDALDRGVFVVAAAGNDGGLDDDGDVATPANVDGVIAVGATARNGSLWAFSSRGSATSGATGETRAAPDQKPEVVAPGDAIVSTGLGGELWRSSGTSDATVFVTAALALILEQHPELRAASTSSDRSTVTLVKEALTDSTIQHPTQTTPHDSRYGYGRLDAVAWEAAVAAAIVAG